MEFFGLGSDPSMTSHKNLWDPWITSVLQPFGSLTNRSKHELPVWEGVGRNTHFSNKKFGVTKVDRCVDDREISSGATPLSFSLDLCSPGG